MLDFSNLNLKTIGKIVFKTVYHSNIKFSLNFTDKIRKVINTQVEEVMGISINGPSGIDTAYIIDSLVDLEYNRVRTVEKRKKAYEVEIEAYSKFQSLIADIGSKAFDLSSVNSFNLYNELSADENVATLSGGAGSLPGKYDVGIYHVAQNEKMISANELVADQTAAMSSYLAGTGEGAIAINGTEITIDANDTIQDLRMKINNATDADGKPVGVNASVIKLADDNFRLVLAAEDTGATGATYEDVGGTVLQDLGIIQDAAGSKGNVAQEVTFSGGFGAAFDGLAAGDTISFAATDHDGNDVAKTYIKKAGDSAEDFAAYLSESFKGMAAAQIDGSNNLVVTDALTGSSQLAFSSFTLNGTPSEMDITTAGDEGGGVLTVGDDAYFSVDGLLMTSSTNSAEGYISGTTINLEKASYDQAVNVEIGRDYDGIVSKIEDLINTYNGLSRFSKTATAYGDPQAEDDEDDQSGDLAGDMTVRSVVGQFRTVLQQQIDLLNTKFKNLTDLGIKTNYTTGELEVDKDKLTSALKSDFNEVVSLFVTKGVSDNSDIALGLKSEETQAGNYVLEEISGNTRIRARLEGETTWYESDARNGDIISFSDGPLKGLSLTSPAGSIPDGTTSTFTYSKGLSGYLKEMVDNMTDSKEGLIRLRQDSLRRSIDNADDRITRLEDRVENYRRRLVKQFSAMEQTLQNLQAQSSNMLSALGYSSAQA
ncbi:MAG: flagellar filament capping protein FliD [Chitinivibrionales bacterium]|nr:flagellar filament capping protein FliD [Chitinivibrionales bacterium]